MTDSIHGSGITYGNGPLWITSTKMKNPKDPPVTLKVDPTTGKTLNSWRTPDLCDARDRSVRGFTFRDNATAMGTKTPYGSFRQWTDRTR